MEKQKRVTVKDIAAHAGVSLGSVHLALSGKPGLKEETRARIRKAADELGYQPNAAAAALKRGALRIGAVFPALTAENTYYYTSIWRGIRDYCQNMSDYNIELMEYPYQDTISVPSSALDGADALNGLVLQGDFTPQAAQQLRKLAESGTMIALIGSDAPETGRLCCVQADNVLLGSLMAEILARQMPENTTLLVCAGDKNTPANVETVQGILQYFQRHRPDLSLEPIWFGLDLPFLRQSLEAKLPRTEISACCSVTARGSAVLAECLRSSPKHLPAIGSDVFEQNLLALREGTFQNLIDKRPYEQAQLAAQILIDSLLRDATPEQAVKLVGSEVIFQSNCHLYEANTERTKL